MNQREWKMLGYLFFGGVMFVLSVGLIALSVTPPQSDVQLPMPTNTSAPTVVPDFPWYVYRVTTASGVYECGFPTAQTGSQYAFIEVRNDKDARDLFPNGGCAVGNNFLPAPDVLNQSVSPTATLTIPVVQVTPTVVNAWFLYTVNGQNVECGFPTQQNRQDLTFVSVTSNLDALNAFPQGICNTNPNTTEPVFVPVGQILR